MYNFTVFLYILDLKAVFALLHNTTTASRPFSLLRTALPFGGYDKASKMLTFELPEVSAATEEPEPVPTQQADIRSRPSFNRTPIGWVCSEDNSHIHTDLEIPFDGETDDL